MSDDQTGNADDLGGEDTPLIRQMRQQMREQANALKALQDDNAALRRDRLFDEVGVPKDGPAAFFRQHYTGELTTDAVRAAADANGFLAPAPPATPVPEQQIHSMLAELQASSTPVIPADHAATGLIQQISQAPDNDAIDAILAANNLIVYDG
jgi:hypothetical protein